jgi:hypothetical protein
VNKKKGLTLKNNCEKENAGSQGKRGHKNYRKD